MLSRACQDHRQSVDAEPDASGRRHRVSKRLDEVRIARLRLRVAGSPLGLLHRETLLLLLAVVQLAEGVRELHSADNGLEPLDDVGSSSVVRANGESSIGQS
jgi:hypothetical protein